MQYVAVVVLVCATLVPMQGSAAIATGTTTQAITSPGVLLYTNMERYKAGLPILTVDDKLSSVAKTKMLDLFARQYFAHTSPSGKDVADLAKDAGYSYAAVGENLALGGFATSKSVVDAWMKSPGHRANILSKGFTQIGIAAGSGLYEGKNAWVIVQSFGTPLSSCPGMDPVVKSNLESIQHLLEALRGIVSRREALLDNHAVPRSEYAARVDSYNAAVKVYNDKVVAYKALVKEYNSGVSSFNVCVKKLVQH